jgi:hypothetical protein
LREHIRVDDSPAKGHCPKSFVFLDRKMSWAIR